MRLEHILSNEDIPGKSIELRENKDIWETKNSADSPQSSAGCRKRQESKSK